MREGIRKAAVSCAHMGAKSFLQQDFCFLCCSTFCFWESACKHKNLLSLAWKQLFLKPSLRNMQQRTLCVRYPFILKEMPSIFPSKCLIWSLFFSLQILAMPCWGVRSLSSYGSSDPVGGMYSSSGWQFPASEELGGNWTSVAELDWTKGCPKAGHHISTEGCCFRSAGHCGVPGGAIALCHLFYILCILLFSPLVLLICVDHKF